MADGYDIHLDGERARRLKQAAEEAGMPIEDFAIRIVDDALDDGWAEADAAFEEYERTGTSFDAREVLQEFREAVEAGLRARGK